MGCRFFSTQPISSKTLIFFGNFAMNAWLEFMEFIGIHKQQILSCQDFEVDSKIKKNCNAVFFLFFNVNDKSPILKLLLP